MKRLYALRGATQAANSTEDICAQTALMYDELLSKNNLEENDIVSAVFSITSDLNAINPCTALRKTGRAGELALFSASEPETQGSLERTVRVLIHCYLPDNSKPSHVYRNGTEGLRAQ